MLMVEFLHQYVLLSYIDTVCWKDFKQPSMEAEYDVDMQDVFWFL